MRGKTSEIGVWVQRTAMAAAIMAACVPAARAASEIGTRILSESDPSYDVTKVAVSGQLYDSYTTFSGKGFAAASASDGVLSVQAERESLVEGAPIAFSAQSRGVAYWHEIVTISSPGLAGQDGVVRISFTINGTIQRTDAATSPAFPDARFYSAYRFNSNYEEPNTPYSASGGTLSYYQSDAFAPGGNFLGIAQTYNVRFIFGQPFSLSLTLEARAEVDTRKAGDVTNDLTQVWNGFQGVTLYNGGATVSSYQTTSQNGVDFSKPIASVPEPATVLLAGLGAGVLLWSGRRKLRNSH